MGLLGVWSGSYVTAKSARNYIDAENIITDASKIKSQLEEVTSLVNNVQKVCSDLTADVLSIDGQDMSGNVDYATQYILETKNANISCLDEIIQRAIAIYNEYQDELNTQAQYEDERKRAENQRTG